MRTESHVDEFKYRNQTGKGQLAKFEACIPMRFWNVKIEDIETSKRQFLKYIIPYCQNLKAARANGYGLCLIGDNGSGKRLPLSTKIFTPSGIKTIGDLDIGDEVIGSNGLPTRVCMVYPIVRAKTYRVTFSDGHYIDSDIGHLWTLDVLRNSHNGDPIIERKTKPLSEWVKEDLKTKRGWCRLWLPILSGPIIFDSKKTLPIDPYTLGVLLGDGSIRMSPVVTIGNNDLDIIDNLVLPKGVLIRTRQKQGCVCVGLISKEKGKGSNQLINELRLLGLWGLKSRNKFVPNEYLFSSVDDRLAILRGLLDTDGSPSRRCASFSSKSKQLANSVRFLTESLGGVASLSLNKNGVYTVISKLPYGVCPFLTKYKKKKFNEATYRTRRAYDPKRKVISIERTGNKEWCRCITVDAKDGLYTLDGGILTHNTQIASFILCKALERGYFAYYTTVSQLEYDLKRGFSDNKWADRLGLMLESDFLCIDELLKEKYKEADSWMRTQIERILKNRNDNLLPTLLASNKDITDKDYGATLTSLISGCFEKVIMEPGDYRPNLRKKMQEDMGWTK